MAVPLLFYDSGIWVPNKKISNINQRAEMAFLRGTKGCTQNYTKMKISELD